MTSVAPFSVWPRLTRRQGAGTRRLVMLAVAAFIVVGALTAFVKDASAVVCPPPTGYKSIGATCYYVNGVIVDVQLFKTGNVVRNPKKFQATISGTSTDTGVLFCGNNGGNQAPGQRIIQFPPDLKVFCDVALKASDVDSQQNGGTADHVICDAHPTVDQLNDLSGQCSNGQFAIDFVPCQFNSAVEYIDATDGSTIEEANHRCVLDSCETLRWNNKAGMPEFRQYSCVGPTP
jgi:hypothetical protein